jgi:hypothetical protein
LIGCDHYDSLKKKEEIDYHLIEIQRNIKRPKIENPIPNLRAIIKNIKIKEAVEEKLKIVLTNGKLLLKFVTTLVIDN